MPKRRVSKKVAAKMETTAPGKLSFPIVALGASAGGLEALERFFKAVASDSGMAYIVIVHLDPGHVSLLPELLKKFTSMPVQQITDGTVVKANNVYVIPPNKDLLILNGRLQLMAISQPRGVNRPIDSFFRALATDQGSKAICIVLSGTGSDGAIGLKAIKGELGMVMAQDEESAKFDGMPRSAINTGLVDFVLTPEAMPEQLLIYNRQAQQKLKFVLPESVDQLPNALQKIYLILRSRTSHDFSLYKKNTICRRIERRMHIHQIESIDDYTEFLNKSEREADILFKELLIGVTNFFRDSEVFDKLRDVYLKELFKNKSDGDTIRVWVAGCSTGEEGYSLAIILQECMEQLHYHFNVQIFCTDIDEHAISIARAGLYPETIEADVSPERLKRNFIREENGHYRIKKSIREMLVFAPQNLIKDPPFTKLDILSCRNLLIYLDSSLQKKLYPVFHYSLKENGLLLLGTSESIGQNSSLFSVVDKKRKIFRKMRTVAEYPVMFTKRATELSRHESIEISKKMKPLEEISALQLVESILQQSNAPPCAIIKDDNNVIYIHGRTGRFLEPAQGKMSINILELARYGIKAKLAEAIRKVATFKKEVIYHGLALNNKDERIFLNLSVKPILEMSNMPGLMMVVFEETQQASKKSNIEPNIVDRQNDKTAEELNQELQFTQEDLQATIKELEAANEELQSTNEELQSTNEEMETSKEEMQSLNEESITVNAELQGRINELTIANDDVKNLLDSIEIATVFLNIDLCVRRFTPKFCDITPLTANDIDRPIAHFSSRLIDVDMTQLATQVLNDLVTREAEVNSIDGKVFIMKIRPYRTSANVIDGVVITLEDITVRKQAELKRFEAESLFRSYFELGLIGMAVISPDKNWVHLNEEVCQMLGYSHDELMQHNWLDISHPDERATETTEFNRLLSDESVVSRRSRRLIRKSGETIEVSIDARRVKKETGTDDYIVALIQDISERKTIQSKLEESELKYRSLFDLANDSLVLIDVATGVLVDFNTIANERLGYTTDEFSQLHIGDIENFKSLAEFKKKFKRHEVNDSSIYLSKHKHKSGKELDVEVKIKNIPLHGKDLYLSTWRYP